MAAEWAQKVCGFSNTECEHPADVPVISERGEGIQLGYVPCSLRERTPQRVHRLREVGSVLVQVLAPSRHKARVRSKGSARLGWRRSRARPRSSGLCARGPCGRDGNGARISLQSRSAQTAVALDPLHDTMRTRRNQASAVMNASIPAFFFRSRHPEAYLGPWDKQKNDSG